MPRMMHDEFGEVNERSFPAVALDDRLRSQLEVLKEEKLIYGYEDTGGLVTLWRPWIKGQTQEEFFRTLTAVERLRSSRNLFQLVSAELDRIRWGHGALHPRNMIYREEGGCVLTDYLFNSTRLYPHVVSQGGPWLWGHCIPDGWSVKDWDRVSLLRTVTLLSEGPADWEVYISPGRVVSKAREWGDEIIQANGGLRSEPELKSALRLLDSVAQASFSPRPSSGSSRLCNSGDQEAVRREVWGGLMEARMLIQSGRLREASELLDKIFEVRLGDNGNAC